MIGMYGVGFATLHLSRYTHYNYKFFMALLQHFTGYFLAHKMAMYTRSK